MIRDRLIRDGPEQGEGEQVAVASLVYDHHAHDLAGRLLDKQHHHELVIATMHAHLGERVCLEVIALRGPAAQVRRLGDELVASRGVLHGEVQFTGSEAGFTDWH